MAMPVIEFSPPNSVSHDVVPCYMPLKAEKIVCFIFKSAFWKRIPVPSTISGNNKSWLLKGHLSLRPLPTATPIKVLLALPLPGLSWPSVSSS